MYHCTGMKPLRKALPSPRADACTHHRPGSRSPCCGRACREGGSPGVAASPGLSEGGSNGARLTAQSEGTAEVGAAGFSQVKRVFLQVMDSWEEGDGL